jgi:hypothetical protein
MTEEVYSEETWLWLRTARLRLTSVLMVIHQLRDRERLRQSKQLAT